MTPWVLLVLSTAVGSDVDQDTADRHARAEGSRSGVDPGGSAILEPSLVADGSAGRRLEHASGVSGGSGGAAAVTKAAVGPRYGRTSLDVDLRPRLELDHLGSAAGGKIEHQEGFGAGFALEVGFPYLVVGEERRACIAWRFELGMMRLLDDHRPPDADYASTLDLLSLQAALLFRYTLLGEFADLSLAAGPAFTYVRAFEKFSDGVPDLDQTLIEGIALWPIARADFHRGLFGGRAFAEVMAVIANVRVTGYMDQYDSLISGYSNMMVTPRLSVGHLWPIDLGFEVGLGYQADVAGAVAGQVSIGHSFALAMRWSHFAID